MKIGTEMKDTRNMTCSNRPVTVQHSGLCLAVWLALLGTVFLGVSVAPADIVISQVYGGGGDSGAPYQNDFIEIYNRGPTPQSLAGWSVQYADATAMTWAVTPLTSVTLQPGQYYLVKEASNGAVGALLPTADATGTINLSDTTGKVALVNATATLVSACTAPVGVTVLDFVFYGPTTNCVEGGGRAPAGSNTTAVTRVNEGCTDTNSNDTDFVTAAPNPRNTASTFHTLPTCTITAASCVVAGSTGNTASVPDAGGGATYTWTLTNATITAGAGTNSIVYTAGASGSVGLSVTIAELTGCSITCSTSVPTDVTVSTNGGDRLECIGQQTCPLGGNTPPVGGSGLWTVESGGTGTFTNAANGNSNFTPTSGTSIVLKWTVSSPCGPDASSTLIVSIFSCQNGGICVHNPCSPFANCACLTGYSGVLCQNVLSGACCLPNNAGCQFITIVQCNSLNGTWSMNQCPDPATVGGPQTICSGGTTDFLGGNFPVQGTSQWSVVSGGTGTFNPFFMVPSATFTHTGGSGPIILRWTNTNSICTTRADVTVMVIPGGSGDGNASGSARGDDIQGCVDALLLGGAPSATYCAYDMNANGVVDINDIAGFVTVLLGP
jgi:hypothetical protein